MASDAPAEDGLGSVDVHRHRVGEVVHQARVPGDRLHMTSALRGGGRIPKSKPKSICAVVSSDAWAKLRDWASVAGRGRLLLSDSVAHALSKPL